MYLLSAGGDVSIDSHIEKQAKRNINKTRDDQFAHAKPLVGATR
jgi:hypothetical protein